MCDSRLEKKVGNRVINPSLKDQVIASSAQEENHLAESRRRDGASSDLFGCSEKCC